MKKERVWQPFLMRLPISTTRYDKTMRFTLHVLTFLYKRLHRLSRGRFGRTLFGRSPILWLTTPGRMSGEHRVTPLLCAEDDAGNWIVAGSAGGDSKTPNWAFNARTAALNPKSRCWIEKSGELKEIKIVELTDEIERSAAYKRLIGKWPFFHNYAERAAPIIPVFRLMPITSPTDREH